MRNKKKKKTQHTLYVYSLGILCCGYDYELQVNLRAQYQ